MAVPKKKKEKSKKNDFTDSFESKEKALDTALKEIEKRFGKGAVMKLGEKSNIEVEVISTGSISIDVALGVGGIPKGRVVEIFGPEASGKTTLALHIIAEAQRAGGITGFIDAEHALDPTYAKKLGVDIESLYISQPDNGEQALEIVETMVRSGAIDLVVIDSVAALVPRAEIDGDMGASHMGLQARLMSQALRKLTAFIAKTNCTVIFINQLREKLNISFGNPETTTGGRALKFYSSIRIDIRRKAAIKDGDQVIGNLTSVKIAKNKVAPPFKTVELDMIFGEGFSKMNDLIDVASGVEIINKSGAWYSYGETRLGQGKDNAKRFLLENSEIADEIDEKTRIHFGLIKGADDEDETNDKSEKNESKPEKKKQAAKEVEKEGLDDEIELDFEELDFDEDDSSEEL